MPRTTENELHAAFALAKKGDFSGLGVLVAGLGTDRNEVRLRAAYYCALVGHPAAIAPLIRMIKMDPDSDNRGQAMYALAGIGRPEVVPPLIALLGDTDPSRRSDAGTALHQVLGDRIVRLLSDEEASGSPHTRRDPGRADELDGRRFRPKTARESDCQVGKVVGKEQRAVRTWAPVFLRASGSLIVRTIVADRGYGTGGR